MKKDKRVKDVHAVHIWSLCSNIIVMSAHVLVNKQKINDTCEIINGLNKKLDKFGIKHTTFHSSARAAVQILNSGISFIKEDTFIYYLKLE